MKSEKSWPGRARGKILHFVPGRVGLGPKFQFSFRGGPSRNFFALLRAGPGRDCSHAGRAGRGLKNSARADLYSHLRFQVLSVKAV